MKTCEFVEGQAVRHVDGGPVMTVQVAVEHLLLCVWMEEGGRVRRQTFAASELVHYDPAHLAWLQAFVRLASRWKVAATY